MDGTYGIHGAANIVEVSTRSQSSLNLSPVPVLFHCSFERLISLSTPSQAGRKSNSGACTHQLSDDIFANGPELGSYISCDCSKVDLNAGGDADDAVVDRGGGVVMAAFIQSSSFGLCQGSRLNVGGARKTLARSLQIFDVRLFYSDLRQPTSQGREPFANYSGEPC